MSASPVSLKHILLATDFSPASARAAEVAFALARRTGAGLHVLHVDQSPNESAVALGQLDRVSAALAQDGTVQVETFLETGVPSREIARHAALAGIDLIVMGTPRAGHDRLGSGPSVTEAVRAAAPCPVLAVKTGPVPAHPKRRPSPPAPAAHCFVCAAPGGAPICETCSRMIMGEARQHKLRELGARP